MNALVAETTETSRNTRNKAGGSHAMSTPIPSAFFAGFRVFRDQRNPGVSGNAQSMKG